MIKDAEISREVVISAVLFSERTGDMGFMCYLDNELFLLKHIHEFMQRSKSVWTIEMYLGF